MSVNITWSSTNGGAAITEPLDHGSAAAGNILSDQEIFIRHDATNPITNCRFYLTSTVPADLAEILSWGDASIADDFGGIQINMDAITSYPTWSTVGTKSGTHYNVFRTGVGDSADNGILLTANSGLTGSAGTLQAGSSPNVRFKLRVQIPTNEDTTGARVFAQKMRFTFTS